MSKFVVFVVVFISVLNLSHAQARARHHVHHHTRHHHSKAVSRPADTIRRVDPIRGYPDRVDNKQDWGQTKEVSYLEPVWETQMGLSQTPIPETHAVVTEVKYKTVTVQAPNSRRAELGALAFAFLLLAGSTFGIIGIKRKPV